MIEWIADKLFDYLEDKKWYKWLQKAAEGSNYALHR